MRSHAFVLVTTVVASATMAGCLSSGGVADNGDAGGTGSSSGGPSPDAGADPTQDSLDVDAITYRDDLSKHPGCTTQGLAYTPASIAGYPCAAKEYKPAQEDTSKPIVLLVHGNSSSPMDFEVCPTGGSDPVTSGCVANSPPMLSERLVAAGFHAFAIDMRPDMSDDPTCQQGPTCNAAKNMDHAWGVPIVMSFLQAMFAAYPTREFSMVGFSYGPGVIRDALRRLHRLGQQPFARIRDLVFVSGGHHGVATYQHLCQNEQSPANTSMAGRCACEMGDRSAYTQTPFHLPLNGASSTADFETPCSDGSSAFGQTGVCGGHTVRYTTLVMQDISQGTYQDEFVSQAAAALEGADNETDALTDQDQTGYFYNGAFKNHFGSIRSEAALTKMMSWLSR
jgi:pimeloyl-ACP methyl ester carboxylesterase